MKSANIVAIGMLCASFSAPAWADLNIKEVLIQKKSPNVNIRVVVNNPGASVQPGPVLIKVYVRHDSSGSWHLIQTWNDISAIKPGTEIARDLFDENSKELTKLAKHTGFQVRAVVRAPGVGETELTGIYGNN